MKIAIAGGTGFVGKALVQKLAQKNHEVIVLSRSKKMSVENNIQYIQWLSPNSSPIDSLQGTDIFINLAGESISGGKWTEKRKGQILDSRINSLEEVLKIMKKLDPMPQLLINASAVGFYGTSEARSFTESDEGTNNDFLSHTVSMWENKAMEAKKFGIRTVICRFGVILDKNEGALPKMVLPYKVFTGGTVGTGRQWLSWIHIEDVINGILFVMDHRQIQGPVNFTAPNPVTMKEFGKALGAVLLRPHFIPAPSFAIKLLLGEMSMIVLEGQKVLPKKLLENGFQFQFSHIKNALKNIFPK